MNFIEFTRGDGTKFLCDIDSGWEIYDRGEKPASWVNNSEGRNLDAAETYAEVRMRLLQSPEIDPHLLKKLQHVDAAFVAEVRAMPLHELQRRVLIQKDWLGSYSRCLDGLGMKVGVESARDPRCIRRAVEELLS